MAGQEEKHGIDYLIEKSRSYKMTPDQEQQRRRSFAYGNAAFENELITREMIAEEDEKQRGRGKR